MDFCCSRTKNGELWKTQLSLDYDLHLVMELVWNSRAVCSPLSRIRIVRKHERRAQHERKSNPEMSGIVISSFSDDLEGCSKSVPPASSTKTFSLIGFSWDPLGIPNHRIACPKRCRGSGGKRKALPSSSSSSDQEFWNPPRVGKRQDRKRAFGATRLIWKERKYALKRLIWIDMKFNRRKVRNGGKVDEKY